MEIFELLLQLNQNTAYDHLLFEEPYSEKKRYRLAEIIRKRLWQWYVMHEDAFSDSDDPGNLFSRIAEQYYWEMRKIVV